MCILSLIETAEKTSLEEDFLSTIKMGLQNFSEKNSVKEKSALDEDRVRIGLCIHENSLFRLMTNRGGL